MKHDSSGRHIDFSMILASSVHDMKNSLGLLLNSIENLCAEHPPTNNEEYARYSLLNYEASRVNNNLIQLLSLYRLQHTELTISIDETYIADLLQEQLALNEPLLNARRIVPVVECDDELIGYLDTSLVAGALNNVILNSIRYTRDRLRIAAYMQNDYLVIEVEDNGEGYPESMCAQGGQQSRPVDFASGSTNLGLFFSREIALMHRQDDRQGYIELLNGGTWGGGIFRLHLP